VKYKIALLRRKIWVRKIDKMFDYYPAISEAEATEITDWVILMRIGRRVAYDRWQLDSKQSVMMFMLRWR